MMGRAIERKAASLPPEDARSFDCLPDPRLFQPRSAGQAKWSYPRPTDAELRTFRSRAAQTEAQLRRSGLRTVRWLVPYFVQPFGGIHTILRFADLWRTRHGVHSELLVYDRADASPSDIERQIQILYPQLPARARVLRNPDELRALPPSDLAIATLWTSAWLLPRLPNARAYAYFVQDDEASFYGAEEGGAAAEETYRLGLYGIFNTSGLKETLVARHGMRGIHFTPAVDRDVFHDRRGQRAPGGPTRIFFYGRPSSPRNAFELGLAALREVKRRFGPEVDIYAAGEAFSPDAYGLTGIVRNLGVLPYEQTAALYRRTDVGVCFMFSSHPSYLPLELMGCGAAVVTNANPANGWLFEHERNCLLSRTSPLSVADQVERLCRDLPLREALAEAGREKVLAASWEQEADLVYATLAGQHP